MKVKVIHDYFDKVEQRPRHYGEVFCCSEERYREILSVDNFVEEIKEEEKPKKK